MQMNQQMHENAAQQRLLMNQVVASNQTKDNLVRALASSLNALSYLPQMHHNEGLFHELQAARHLREEQNKQVQEYSQATVSFVFWSEQQAKDLRLCSAGPAEAAL
jgi:hypothetical protein